MLQQKNENLDNLKFCAAKFPRKIDCTLVNLETFYDVRNACDFLVVKTSTYKEPNCSINKSKILDSRQKLKLDLL